MLSAWFSALFHLCVEHKATWQYISCQHTSFLNQQGILHQYEILNPPTPSTPKGHNKHIDSKTKQISLLVLFFTAPYHATLVTYRTMYAPYLCNVYQTLRDCSKPHNAVLLPYRTSHLLVPCH